MIAATDGACSPPPRSWQPADGAAVGPARTPPRFTLDGNAELESRLAGTCDAVLAGIRGLIPPRRLEAVLLGGGYGRREGGVMQTGEGERPYNDLEFYVCLRGNRHLNERRHHLPLEVLGEILTPRAGVEVEFKIISLAELRRSRISMFSYDLLLGHRWLLGNGGLLFGCTHHRIAEDIPPAEATRLLMNRCSGLLFAQERLERDEFTGADADFVQRNLAKAELAFGDAVLTTFGQYHWSCQERHRRLQRLAPAEPPAWLDEVRTRHAAGLKFKLHPERSAASREALRASHAAVAALGLQVWLWQERGRLGAPFASAGAYAESKVNKCPETRRARNLLVNLKLAGLRSLFQSDPFRHPRERALHALCSLLWERAARPPPPRRDPPGAALGPPPAPFSDQVSSYRALWQRVN
jgi:hypothetical protein